IDRRAEEADLCDTADDRRGDPAVAGPLRQGDNPGRPRAVGERGAVHLRPGTEVLGDLTDPTREASRGASPATWRRAACDAIFCPGRRRPPPQPFSPPARASCKAARGAKATSPICRSSPRTGKRCDSTTTW